VTYNYIIRPVAKRGATKGVYILVTFYDFLMKLKALIAVGISSSVSII
jgi:hypothetical protein